MATAIPKWTSEQFPSKKAAISTTVAWRLVAADSNSLWICLSSTRKLCEESGPALGRFCSVAVYKEVSKELIRREKSLCFNRRNWKPCCGRVISAKQLPQQNQLRLWEKEADKGLLIPVTTETSGWNWAECFPAHTLGLRESFSCFFSLHSSASSLPGLVWHLLHRFAWSAIGVFSAGKPIYSLQCSYKPALPPSFCTAFYLQYTVGLIAYLFLPCPCWRTAWLDQATAASA